MNLLDHQRGFREHLLAGDEEPVAPLDPGLTIYRNAYRARLLGALEESYERTRQWTGDDAFEAAACHHIILNPPVSWTLDDYGAGFGETLSGLFANDPEVGELAWLEWHMSRAFAAPDCAVLDPGALLSGPMADGDWEGAQLEFVTSFAMRKVRIACTALWLALGNNRAAAEAKLLPAPTALIVWRKEHSPHFRLVDDAEAAALVALAAGTPFGAVCAELAATSGAEAAVSQIGSWLGQWLQDGILSPAAPDRP